MQRVLCGCTSPVADWLSARESVHYLWTFIMSLNEAPGVVDQLARLRDIGRRVAVPAAEVAKV
jgi:hypothetical protein